MGFNSSSEKYQYIRVKGITVPYLSTNCAFLTQKNIIILKMHLFVHIDRSGAIDQLVAMRTTEYTYKERDYVPWLAVYNNIMYVDRMLALTGSYGYLQVLKIISFIWGFFWR